MTTWILFSKTAHVVAETDGEKRTTTCGGVFYGYDGIADLEDFDFPPEACANCKSEIAMSVVEPEPLDVALNRGFEPRE